MSEERREQRAKEFLLYAAGAALVLVALAIILFVVRPGGSDDGTDPSSTSVVPTTIDAAGNDGEDADAPEAFPEDRVAFVTAEGSVMSGIGAEAPIEVASKAALNDAGQASLSLSPTGDLIVYVRRDGALVSVPVEGGDPKVLATDVWMPSVGSTSMITWDAVSEKIAYLAVGTADMVEPRPDEPETLPDGVHSRPLPEGELGAVIKIIDRAGKVRNRIGDPSTRSITGITYSSTDDLMLVESSIPGEGRPYSLATTSSDAMEIVGTPLSADAPSFSPDGNFIVAVGPRPGGMNEMLRISAVQLSISVLTSDDRICFPSVSPDSTRIVYGAGADCSRLMLISSLGGQPVDVTPNDRPGQTFETQPVQWTQDGHFLAFPDCRTDDDGTTCSGKVVFVDPDRAVMINGPVATTVTTVIRPLMTDLNVHVAMSGPISYEGAFVVDSASEAELEDVSKTESLVDVTLSNGDRTLAIKAEFESGRKFASGTMRIVDPEKGLNRTFVITGTASLLGLRVASMSGIWISTTDLPFMTGEFRISVLRGT